MNKYFILGIVMVFVLIGMVGNVLGDNRCQEQYDWQLDALDVELNNTKMFQMIPDDYFNDSLQNVGGTWQFASLKNGENLTLLNYTSSGICNKSEFCMNITYNMSARSGRGDLFVSRSLPKNYLNYTGVGFWYKGDGSPNYLSWVGVGSNATQSTSYNHKSISPETNCYLNYTGWNINWKYCYVDFSTLINFSGSSNPTPPMYQFTSIKTVIISVFNGTNVNGVENGSVYSFFVSNVSIVDWDMGNMYYLRWQNHTVWDRNFRWNEGVTNIAWLYSNNISNETFLNDTLINYTVTILDYYSTHQFGDGGWSEYLKDTHSGIVTIGFTGSSFAYAFDKIRFNRTYMDTIITGFKFDSVNTTVMTNAQGSFYVMSREAFYNLTMERTANYSLSYSTPSSFAGNQEIGRLNQLWWYTNYSKKYEIYNSTFNFILDKYLNDWQFSRFGFLREVNTSTYIGYDVGYHDVTLSFASIFYLDNRLEEARTLLNGLSNLYLNTFNDYNAYLVNGSRGSVVGNGNYESQIGYAGSEINNPFLYQINYLSILKYGVNGSSLNGNNISGSSPYRSTYAVVKSSDYCAHKSIGNGFRFPLNYSYFSFDILNETSFVYRNLSASKNISSISGLHFPRMLFAYDNNNSWWIRGDYLTLNNTDFIYSDENGNFTLPIIPNIRTYNGNEIQLSNNISEGIGLNVTINKTEFAYYQNQYIKINNNQSKHTIKIFNHQLTNALIYISNGSVGCSNINSCDNNINITLTPNNVSYVLDNFNLTEGYSREYSPIWISSKSDNGRVLTYHLASNLSDTITNLSIYLNLSTNYSHIYLSPNSTEDILIYNSSDLSYSSLTFINNTIISPDTNLLSNEEIVNYGTSSKNVTLKSLKNALIYFDNNSLPNGVNSVILNNDNNINITIPSKNTTYILDEFNITLGQLQRENDPLFNTTTNSTNNTLNSQVIIPIYSVSVNRTIKDNTNNIYLFTSTSNSRNNYNLTADPNELYQIQDYSCIVPYNSYNFSFNNLCTGISNNTDIYINKSSDFTYFKNNNVNNVLINISYNLNNALIFNTNGSTYGNSNINLNDENINITLPPKNNTCIFNNANFTEDTLRGSGTCGYPFWVSASYSSEKHLANNLSSPVNITIYLNATNTIDCNTINRLRYSPDSGTDLNFYGSDAVLICKQLVNETGYELQLNPSISSNVIYFYIPSSIPPASSGGGSSGTDLNPKNVLISYSLKWTLGKKVNISIETYNQLNNLYNPPLIEFEYDKNQLSLLEKIYNLDSNITKVVFLVYSNATLGDKSIKLKVNDQKTYEKEINFEIVKEEIKGIPIKPISKIDKITNFIKEDYIIYIFLATLFLIVIIGGIVIIINTTKRKKGI